MICKYFWNQNFENLIKAVTLLLQKRHALRKPSHVILGGGAFNTHLYSKALALNSRVSDLGTLSTHLSNALQTDQRQSAPLRMIQFVG